METLPFLKSCSLFRNVEEKILDEVQKELRPFPISSGKTLISEKIPPEGVYLVYRGRLARFRDEAFLEEYLEGDHIGDRHFITKIMDASKIKALRDSHLLLIPKNFFFTLIQKYPFILQNACKSLALSVHQGMRREKKKKRAQIFTLIPHEPHPSFSAFCQKLQERFNNALLLHEGDENLLGKYEKEGKPLLLVGNHKSDPWTRLTLNFADKILIVAHPKDHKALSSIEEEIAQNTFAEKKLLLLHEKKGEITKTKGWLKERRSYTHEHVFLDEEASIDRLHRILIKKSLGIVFSGGGARGIAQIGFLIALMEKKIPIDFVGGTSVGSIIAALYALGWTEQDLLTKGPDIFVKDGGLIDFTFPFAGLLKGKKAYEKIVKYTVGKDIEDLETSFFCMSSNLTAKEPHIHKFGSLATALRASIALPGIFPPTYFNHNVLVDGGLFNVLPMDVMVHLFDPGSLIALDTSLDYAKIDSLHFPAALSGWSLIVKKFLKRKKTTPHILEILAKTTDISGQRSKRKQLLEELSDLHIRFPVEKYGTLDFEKYDEIIRVGYDFSSSHLNSWLETL